MKDDRKYLLHILECIQRIEEYRDAGCTHIMLEIWGEDRTGQAKLFGEAVLPYFQK